MQTDGRLAVGNPRGPATWWSTPTAGHPGAFLSLRNDGNLVVSSAGGAQLWASNTCCR